MDNKTLHIDCLSLRRFISKDKSAFNNVNDNGKINVMESKWLLLYHAIHVNNDIMI